jgi:superfamily II RNA helicase
MMTGDASINHRAPVVCCTAEILANFALRDGAYAPIDYVVMDEFHFYSDSDRGIAWQIPLITLSQARFLLMSATLGDVSEFVDGISDFTGVGVALVKSAERPVPLDFEYRQTPLHETITDLVNQNRAPVYVVNFTQREAAEMAQAMTSISLIEKHERKAIQAEMSGTRFDTVYGKDIKRFLSHGVGLHHAGLLPKYRTLVERLAQKGMLKIICGTDTLGVGVNVPIRTVLFTKLCKYDGEQVRILTVRDFKQIAGRAGRKGFDDRGSVVAQAPEHVVENKRLEAKAAASGKKKFQRKKPPERGYVHWDASTFEKLTQSEPEPLESRFKVTHHLLMSVLEREPNAAALHGGYRTVVDLIGRCYERPAVRSRLRRQAASLFRDLRNAGIIEIVPNFVGTRCAVRVAEGLQRDFSLHQTLSLYLLEALSFIDPNAETYALDLVSLVESILENPHAVLRRQLDYVKGELIGRLKADGVEYEERMAQLENVDRPKPCAEFIYRTFDEFRTKHPWVRGENVQPKSIVRDMVERYAGFNEYVKLYGLGRSEGVLLRYLTQAYKALVQTVPESYRDETYEDVLAFLRATLARVDSSLLREWERMMAMPPDEDAELDPDAEPPPIDPAADRKSFYARIRAELHALVKALATEDYEEAVRITRSSADDEWDEARFENELDPFEAENGLPIFDHRARLTHLTHIDETEPRLWRARQTLVSSEDETPWMLEVEVDLREPREDDGPLIEMRRIAI